MIKSIGFKVGFSFTNFMATQFFYDEKSSDYIHCTASCVYGRAWREPAIYKVKN